MAEYLLPVGIIGIVAVASAGLFLGEDFASNGAMRLFQSDRVDKNIGGQAALVQKSFGENPLLQTVRYRTSSGKWITLPDFPKSLPALVETDGAQGSTERYIALMNQLADQLLAAGEITADDAALIRALANKGHRLAQFQSVIEQQAFRCGPDKNCLRDAMQSEAYREAYKNLAYESVRTNLGDNTQQKEGFYREENPFQSFRSLTPTEDQLLQRLDLDQKDNMNAWINYDRSNLIIGEDMYQFLKGFEQVNQRLGSDSNSGKLVSFLSQQIFLNANRTNFTAFTSSFDQTWEEITGQDTEYQRNAFARYTPDQFTDSLAQHLQGPAGRTLAELNHGLSGNICTVGEGSDLGQSCR